MERIERKILSRSESVCPLCLARLPAQRTEENGVVFLEKTCPEHGFFRSEIWGGHLPFESWQRLKEASAPRQPATAVNRGCPYDCGLCPAHRQQSCCVLLEVTTRCDLCCPICFASSVARDDEHGQAPASVGQAHGPQRPVSGGKRNADPNGLTAKEAGEMDPSFDTLLETMRQLREGGRTLNLQLSGGEPTTRNDLPELIRRGKEMGHPFFQLNTNGLRIAGEEGYAGSLAQAGLDCVFLQFDGLSDRSYEKIRGRALLAIKEKAIRACRDVGLGVVLVPTICEGVNTGEIGAILDYALDHLPTVRGVHFQPMAYFGRYPQQVPERRFTLSHLLWEIERQTGGRMKMSDFSPGGAENAYCSFSGGFVVDRDGRLRAKKGERACGCGGGERTPPGASDGAARSRAHVAKVWKGVGKAALTPQRTTASLDNFLEQLRSRSLAVSAMAFMDAWNLDLQRLRDCYIHVADGKKLIPFCAYNLSALDGRTLYRP